MGAQPNLKTMEDGAQPNLKTMEDGAQPNLKTMEDGDSAQFEDNGGWGLSQI